MNNHYPNEQFNKTIHFLNGNAGKLNYQSRAQNTCFETLVLLVDRYVQFNFFGSKYVLFNCLSLNYMQITRKIRALYISPGILSQTRSPTQHFIRK